jgi:hypothetical protein
VCARGRNIRRKDELRKDATHLQAPNFLAFLLFHRKKDTQEKRQRSSKTGKLKSKVDKRKSGEEGDRRPGRYIEGFQSSEPRKKRSKSPNLYVWFSLCSRMLKYLYLKFLVHS